jgi:hypothetical protein
LTILGAASSGADAALLAPVGPLTPLAPDGAPDPTAWVAAARSTNVTATPTQRRLVATTALRRRRIRGAPVPIDEA